MVARAKVWVCGRSLAEGAGSNPTGSMDVCCEVDHHAVINFVGRRITLQIDGEYTEGGFIGIRETANKLGSIEHSSSENKFHIFGHVSNFPRKILSLTAC